MKAVALMYHDVVDANYDSSGFPGDVAARYKVTRAEFDSHLAAISAVVRRPGRADELFAQPAMTQVPLLLTFDDGGASSLNVGEILEQRKWPGHFFIPVDYVGSPGFVSRDDVRALHAMGHLVGSHSCSHPHRMSRCPWSQLLHEWRESIEVLTEIVGEPVSLASVPGGYYSPRVGRAAAAAGINVLFSSEPVVSVRNVETCLVVGRYSIVRGTSAAVAAGLAAGSMPPRVRQFAAWNAKRAAKIMLGRRYRTARDAILRRV